MSYVVIPAYCPDRTLVSLVEQMWETGCMMIVVDDGSGEEYQSIFDEISDVSVILRHPENSGKGAAIKSALEYIEQKHSHRDVVGIMDADITGPSIPKMYGIKGNAQGSDNGIYPMPTANGIEVMSVNLLLPDEETPVIWRGPVLANMVKQFWSDVIWGELDYLFVDMPPGTGDVPLTVFQSLPIEGVVIVTSPQDLVRMIVKKAYNMADMMKVPVLGIVENYSYVKCPDCGKEIKVFGESHIDEIAAELKVPVLGKMPIDVKLAELADSGLFSKIENEYITAAADVMPKDEA